MNNSVLRENVRKHRDIILVTIKRTRHYFLFEPNYHATRFFTKKVVSYRNGKSANSYE